MLLPGNRRTRLARLDCSSHRGRTCSSACAALYQMNPSPAPPAGFLLVRSFVHVQKMAGEQAATVRCPTARRPGYKPGQESNLRYPLLRRRNRYLRHRPFSCWCAHSVRWLFMAREQAVAAFPLLYPIELPRVASGEGFEPPTHGLRSIRDLRHWSF